MKKPMIFFLLHLAKEPLCFFRRSDFPPNSRSMKVIPVEKKKHWIPRCGILIEIFRQDDEEPFLLIQHGRKKDLISNQVVIRLGGLREKEIGKGWVFRAARGLRTGGDKRAE
jgi:hypothetical protein